MGHAANPRDDVVRLGLPVGGGQRVPARVEQPSARTVAPKLQVGQLVPHETGEAVARLSPAAGRDVRNGPPSGVGRGRTGQRDR